jgi:hypothetical protein
MSNEIKDDLLSNGTVRALNRLIRIAAYLRHDITSVAVEVKNIDYVQIKSAVLTHRQCDATIHVYQGCDAVHDSTADS